VQDFLRGRETVFSKCISDENGATAIEYGLIAALIAVAAIIAFQTLGLNLADLFNGIADLIEGPST